MKLPSEEKAVSLTFYCTEDRKVNVEIAPVEVDGVVGEIDNDHIATRWARLGMRYFSQMKEKNMFVDSVPHVKDVRMVIVFSNSRTFLDAATVSFDDLEVVSLIDNENVDYDDYPEDDIVGDDLAWSIGFNLFSETTDLIGGLATPSAVAAMAVYKLILAARSQVKD